MSELKQSTIAPQSDDPLAHLHKMSTTAGLGSADYVAINGTSVLAILLGLASALSLMADILLIIPLVGVVAAVVALRQIGRSSGTQTGRGLAWLGLILSIGFAALVGGRQVVHARTTAADRQIIAQMIQQFDAHVRAAQYDQAYAMFSTSFAQRVPATEFANRWKGLQESPFAGAIKSITWNERLMFITDPATGAQYARGLVIMDFEKTSSPLRQDILFRKEGDKWLIEDLGGLFQSMPGGQEMPGAMGP